MMDKIYWEPEFLEKLSLYRKYHDGHVPGCVGVNRRGTERKVDGLDG